MPSLIRYKEKTWDPALPEAHKPFLVHTPSYGKYLEDFHPEALYWHPRSLTIDESFAREFAATFMESCPIFTNSDFARRCGYKGLPVSPLMVLATTLSLGVENDSEKAIAHLGYFNVLFPEPFFAGETLSAVTEILDVRARDADEPGIVHVRSAGLNGQKKPVVIYERKIMIPKRPPEALARADVTPAPGKKGAPFPAQGSRYTSFPKAALKAPIVASGMNFNDLAEGEIVLHPNGRTVTDEHFQWTFRIGNTHPLHFDSGYSQRQEGAMGGVPAVFGGFVFSWINGLASRDLTQNLIWDLGYHNGYHTQPVRSGDTLYAISRILKKEKGPSAGTGILTIQLIGIKNLRPAEALEKMGEKLFLRENEKKARGLPKIPEKVFEIERRVLVRFSPAKPGRRPK